MNHVFIQLRDCSEQRWGRIGVESGFQSLLAAPPPSLAQFVPPPRPARAWHEKEGAGYVCSRSCGGGRRLLTSHTRQGIFFVVCSLVCQKSAREFQTGGKNSSQSYRVLRRSASGAGRRVDCSGSKHGRSAGRHRRRRRRARPLLRPPRPPGRSGLLRNPAEQASNQEGGAQRRRGETRGDVADA